MQHAQSQDTASVQLFQQLHHTGGISICFANPGTTEMHLVSALDQMAKGLEGKNSYFKHVHVWLYRIFAASNQACAAYKHVLPCCPVFHQATATAKVSVPSLACMKQCARAQLTGEHFTTYCLIPQLPQKNAQDSHYACLKKSNGHCDLQCKSVSVRTSRS